MPKTKRLIAVDLFSGCGGLTLGLKMAGLRVAAAVEVSPSAAQTYSSNHRTPKLLNRDIRSVHGGELLTIAGNQPIDLVAGCAPCQGFSSLTRKHNRNDPRNELVLEMCRIIEEVRPSAVLMENVVGLENVGASIFGEFLTRLRAAGYLPTWKRFQMADFGVPQKRSRLVLMAGRGFAIPLPLPTHARSPESVKPRPTLKPWTSVRDAIGGRPAPVTLSQSRRTGGPKSHDWHVVRDLQPQTRERLRAAVPGKGWDNVAEELRPDCHQGPYRGFLNVYGRMEWNEPAPTITSGCTTPAKGRFGHPDRRRLTISVREAAALQGFPDSYRFESEKIDHVCEMIGNAVPPPFAHRLGLAIQTSVLSHRQALFSA